MTHPANDADATDSNHDARSVRSNRHESQTRHRGPTRSLPPMHQPTRRLQLLYFPDCPNWQLADTRLHDVASQLGLSIEHVLVTTTEAAERLSFRGSPTILIDGIDPFAAGDEPIGLSCRIYLTPHGYEGSPTTAQLAAALAATG